MLLKLVNQIVICMLNNYNSETMLYKELAKWLRLQVLYALDERPPKKRHCGIHAQVHSSQRRHDISHTDQKARTKTVDLHSTDEIPIETKISIFYEFVRSRRNVKQT